MDRLLFEALDVTGRSNRCAKDEALAQARSLIEGVLAQTQETKDQVEEVKASLSLGSLERMCGHESAASTAFEAARRIAEDCDYSAGEAWALIELSDDRRNDRAPEPGLL